MARAPKSTPAETPVVTVLEGKVPVKGLAEFVYLSALIKELTTAKDALMSGFKPVALPHFGKLAGMAGEPKDMGKTFSICEATTEASIQLRAASGVLSAANAAILSKHRLPLTHIAAVECINHEYATDGDLIARLRALFAAHPEAMVPADFFTMAGGGIGPKADGSTLHKALQLPEDQRKIVVPLLANTVVLQPSGTVPDEVKQAVQRQFLTKPAPVSSDPEVVAKTVKKKAVVLPEPVAAEAPSRPRKATHLKLVAAQAEPDRVAMPARAAKKVAPPAAKRRA